MGDGWAVAEIKVQVIKEDLLLVIPKGSVEKENQDI